MPKSHTDPGYDDACAIALASLTDKFEILSQINKIKIIDHILNKKDINDFKVITDDYIEIEFRNHNLYFNKLEWFK